MDEGWLLWYNSDSVFLRLVCYKQQWFSTILPFDKFHKGHGCIVQVVFGLPAKVNFSKQTEGNMLWKCLLWTSGGGPVLFHFSARISYCLQVSESNFSMRPVTVLVYLLQYSGDLGFIPMSSLIFTLSTCSTTLLTHHFFCHTALGKSTSSSSTSLMPWSSSWLVYFALSDLYHYLMA